MTRRDFPELESARLAIKRRLRLAPATAGELAQVLGVPVPRIAYHLLVLRRAGSVVQDAGGRYRLAPRRLS